MTLTLQKRTDVLYYRAMRNLTLPALLTAEAVSSTGSAMTFVALPWFVLVTSGLADEDERRPRGRDPADGAFRDPERLGRRAARRPDVDARRRTRPRAARRARPDPALDRPPHVPAARSGSSSCSGSSWRRTSASQRSILPEVLGDDEKAVAKASGPLRRRAAPADRDRPVDRRRADRRGSGPRRSWSSTARPSCLRSSSCSRWCAAASPSCTTTTAAAFSPVSATSRGTSCSGR